MFFEAWNWLLEHPALKHNSTFHAIQDNLKVFVFLGHYPNENGTVSLSLQVETGPAEYLDVDDDTSDFDDNWVWTHDENLDAEGETFEDAIIVLAGLVKKYYGEYEMSEE